VEKKMGDGLYVHIPFCQKKCFYCAFVVSVLKHHWVDDYLEALSGEARQYRPRSFDTVYIGGGSPSFLDENNIARLFGILSRCFDLNHVSEVSFEMNPEDISREKIDALCSFGVNRVSLGVQSFSNEALSFLGRCHDRERIFEAHDLLKGKGFHSISIDLMYGLPGQGQPQLLKDLDAAIHLSPEHISLYSLTLESPSRFSVHPPDLPDPQTSADLFCFAKSHLESAGYRHYEVSNFCRPGFESRHNLNYWQGGDYIGLGVAAHSHQQGRRWWNVDQTKRYIEQLKNGASPCAGEEILDAEGRLRDALVFGLRMADGVCLSQLEERFGAVIDEGRQQQLETMAEEGFLDFDKSTRRVKTTLKGMLVLDELSVRLI